MVRKKGGEKWQWLRRRTRNRDLGNALPCSNQLSYQVIRQLSGWVQVLRSSCQGSSRSGYQAGMFDGEGVACTKCEAQVQILNLLQLDLTPSQWERKVRNKDEKERKNDSDSGEGLKTATWQMACHALAIWATKSSSSLPFMKAKRYY